MKASGLLPVLAAGLSLLDGCGGGSSGASPPTVSISASPVTVTAGQASTLSWSSAGATSCSASATPGEADWSGAKAVSGTQVVTPPSTGTSTYMLSCTGDGGNTPGSASVTANPAPPLTITTASLPNGTVGMAYGTPHRIGFRRQYATFYQLAASGGGGVLSWSWTAAAGSSLPPGLRCCDLFYPMIPFPGTRVRGTLYGTPTTAGTYQVVVSVTDGVSTATPVTFKLQIDPPPPPIINATPTPAIATLNSPYVGATFTATLGLPPLSWSTTSALPAGLQLSAAGLISGTPTAAGSFLISVVARDSLGRDSLPQDFTIQVLPLGFTPTGSMSTERVWHTATRLVDGTVLVAGGDNSTQFPTTAELYDPVAAAFVATTGNLTGIRFSATATLLANGKVLLVGGKNATDELATGELYDPTTKSFVATKGSMSTTRVYHTATLLNDGTVLVTGGLDSAGGASGTPVDTAEIYDPIADTFTLTGAMSTGRFFHTATLLGDGTVLITGGLNNGATLATAELYHPTMKAFTPAGTMTVARVGHTATVLNNGQVLLTGGGAGFATIAIAAAELYNPNGATFTAVNPMLSPRSLHTATLLNNGQVLVVGGSSLFYFGGSSHSLSSAELFDPTMGTFTATADMTVVRESHTATLLNTGDVLVVGGSNGTLGYSTTTTVYATAELYR